MLVCSVNGQRWRVGSFATPCLAESRKTALAALRLRRQTDATFMLGRPRVRFLYGDVSDLLVHEDLSLATFQVASQFNCLEFVDPHMTPEDGVAIYEDDRTQGPACAIACGPATIVRNYFAQDGIQPLNTLHDTLETLRNKHIEVRGGYSFPRGADGLRSLNALLRRQGVFRDGVSVSPCLRATCLNGVSPCHVPVTACLRAMFVPVRASAASRHRLVFVPLFVHHVTSRHRLVFALFPVVSRRSPSHSQAFVAAVLASLTCSLLRARFFVLASASEACSLH